MEIKVTKTNTLKQKPIDESTLGFARSFSDHMFMVEYEEERCWFDPRIVPYQNISLNPASPVFHYAKFLKGQRPTHLMTAVWGCFASGTTRDA